MKKLAKVIGNIVTAFLILVIIASLYSMIQYKRNPDKPPQVLGYSTMSVLTGSMRPYLQPGDMIVDKAAKAEEVKVGDIITYKAGGSVVTHRVTEVIRADGKFLFTTRGDANNTADGKPITGEQLIGKVIFKIPYGGYIARFIRSPIGLLIILAVPISFIFIGELKNILSGGKKSENTKSKGSVDIN